GLQVLKTLRAHEATAMLPVVVFTSSDLDRDIVESYKLGANSFVSKPVNINDFFAAVQELGLYWMVLNRPPIGDGK
ncbi:MAG: response regulator, partial [Mariprofundaceae bacterium]